MKVNLRFRETKKNGKSYYLDYRNNGKRIREFLDVHVHPSDNKNDRDEKLRIANIIRNKRETELFAGTTGIQPRHLNKKRFATFTDDYIAKYSKRDKNTVKAAIRMFHELAGDDIRASAINPGLMRRYMEHLQGSHLTGETPRNYWRRFSKVLREAMELGYFTEMPNKGITFKKEEGKGLSKQILKIEELRVLKDTACGNNEVKKAFLFACFTGLGMAEIRHLTWRDVQKGEIDIKRQKTGTPIRFKLPAAAIEVMGQPGHREDFVFDIHISETAVNKNIRNWVARADLDKEITFYCARHTFAVLTLSSGANLATVAKLMGHKSIATTTRYLNYLDDEKNRAMENLPSL